MAIQEIIDAKPLFFLQEADQEASYHEVRRALLRRFSLPPQQAVIEAIGALSLVVQGSRQSLCGQDNGRSAWRLYLDDPMWVAGEPYARLNWLGTNIVEESLGRATETLGGLLKKQKEGLGGLFALKTTLSAATRLVKGSWVEEIGEDEEPRFIGETRVKFRFHPSPFPPVEMERLLHVTIDEASKSLRVPRKDILHLVWAAGKQVNSPTSKSPELE